jgi:hypothetical protein
LLGAPKLKDPDLLMRHAYKTATGAQ